MREEITTYIGSVCEYNKDGFGTLKICNKKGDTIYFKLYSNGYAQKQAILDAFYKGNFIGISLDSKNLIEEVFPIGDRITIDTEHKGTV